MMIQGTCVIHMIPQEPPAVKGVGHIRGGSAEGKEAQYTQHAGRLRSGAGNVLKGWLNYDSLWLTMV